MEGKDTIFRKETIDHISSPEQLTSYLRVTNPGVWAVLTAVILILVAIVAWAAIGTLETGVDATVIVRDRTAQVIPLGGESLAAGMPLRVAEQESALVSADTDEYGRSVGIAELSLPDGSYKGTVVVEQIHPIDFLITSR